MLWSLVFGVSLFEGSCLFQSRIANYERVVGEKFGRSVLRLCRLPCGKLRAFRTPLREIEASPGAAQPPKSRMLDGKPQAFRTGGGKAAYNRKVSVSYPPSCAKSSALDACLAGLVWLRYIHCRHDAEGSHNGSAAVLKTADRKVMQVRVLSPPPFLFNLIRQFTLSLTG